MQFSVFFVEYEGDVSRGLATYQECPGTDCQPEHYNCYIPGKRSRGRPCKKWINNIQEDLNCLQLNVKEAMDIVRDRQEWRHRIFQPHRHHWVDGRARRRSVFWDKTYI